MNSNTFKRNKRKVLWLAFIFLTKKFVQKSLISNFQWIQFIKSRHLWWYFHIENFWTKLTFRDQNIRTVAMANIWFNVWHINSFCDKYQRCFMLRSFICHIIVLWKAKLLITISRTFIKAHFSKYQCFIGLCIAVDIGITYKKGFNYFHIYTGYCIPKYPAILFSLSRRLVRNFQP